MSTKDDLSDLNDVDLKSLYAIIQDSTVPQIQDLCNSKRLQKVCKNRLFDIVIQSKIDEFLENLMKQGFQEILKTCADYPILREACNDDTFWEEKFLKDIENGIVFRTIDVDNSAEFTDYKAFMGIPLVEPLKFDRAFYESYLAWSNVDMYLNGNFDRKIANNLNRGNYSKSNKNFYVGEDGKSGILHELERKPKTDPNQYDSKALIKAIIKVFNPPEDRFFPFLTVVKDTLNTKLSFLLPTIAPSPYSGKELSGYSIYELGRAWVNLSPEEKMEFRPNFEKELQSRSLVHLYQANPERFEYYKKLLSEEDWDWEDRDVIWALESMYDMYEAQYWKGYQRKKFSFVGNQPPKPIFVGFINWNSAKSKFKFPKFMEFLNRDLKQFGMEPEQIQNVERYVTGAVEQNSYINPRTGKAEPIDSLWIFYTQDQNPFKYTKGRFKALAQTPFELNEIDLSRDVIALMRKKEKQDRIFREIEAETGVPAVITDVIPTPTKDTESTDTSSEDSSEESSDDDFEVLIEEDSEIKAETKALEARIEAAVEEEYPKSKFEKEELRRIAEGRAEFEPRPEYYFDLGRDWRIKKSEFLDSKPLVIRLEGKMPIPNSRKKTEYLKERPQATILNFSRIYDNDLLVPPLLRIGHDIVSKESLEINTKRLQKLQK